MSEEEKGREMIDDWSHAHPLTLVETRRGDECYGCKLFFSSGEQAYRCSINGCEFSKLLHEECVVMGRRIQHPLHILIHIGQHGCFGTIADSVEILLVVPCSSPGCKFDMHLRCWRYGCDEKRRAIIHHHELKLWRRRCSFKCDACGTTRMGSSYTESTRDAHPCL